MADRQQARILVKDSKPRPAPQPVKRSPQVPALVQPKKG